MNELPFDSLHEECGVFGVFGVDDAPGIVYYGLHALQHRGQEACGIVSAEEGRLASVKGEGLVTEVFNGDNLSTLHGRMAIGHVRYSTAGGGGRENVQPFVFRHHTGDFALAHNGNLVNSRELVRYLEDKGSLFHSTSDSEILAHLIKKEHSSEPCALDIVGAEFVRDVNPGEIVTLDRNGIRSRDYSMYKRNCMCAMEYIYFARPDSDIECCNVHAFRKESGRLLFKEAPADADVVIGVPDSSLSAAIGYSEASGIPYEMGLVKNRYIGRTFIQPSQAMREKGVKMKLSAVRSLVAGKRVALIDDSIVRGTTSLRIVRLLKAAGAKEVHVRIASPKMTHPCFYGVDTSTCDQLIGHRCSVEEICRQIEADSLAFLSEGALLRAGNRKEMCMACFTGRYPTALYEHAAEIGRKEDKNR